MVLGIEAAAIYRPRTRVGEQTLAALGEPKGIGRRIISDDEDIGTMLVALLEKLGPAYVDLPLYLAAPGSSHESAIAIAVAEAVGMSARDRRVDLWAWSPRALVSMLTSALSGVERTVVVAIDVGGRSIANPIAPTGDLAVAFVVGDPRIAELVSTAHITALTYDDWRNARLERTGPDPRFVEAALYADVGRSLVAELLKEAGLGADTGPRIALGLGSVVPFARGVRAVGGTPGRLALKLANKAGGDAVGGAAHILLAELSEAEEGSFVAVVGLSYGGDALLVRAGSDAVSVGALLGLKPSVERGLIWYLRTREVIPVEQPDPSTSFPELWRESPGLLGLHSSQCNSCKHISYPRRAICESCRSTDQLPYQLARTGTVITHTVDKLFPSAGQPVQMVAVAVDGGDSSMVRQPQMSAIQSRWVKKHDS